MLVIFLLLFLTVCRYHKVYCELGITMLQSDSAFAGRGKSEIN